MQNLVKFMNQCEYFRNKEHYEALSHGPTTSQDKVAPQKGE
jgi:hypothetical protein